MEPSPGAAGSRVPVGRALALAGLLATAFVVAWQLGMFTPAFREALQQALQQLGPWAPLAFVAIKVVTVVLALPSAPVTFAGGVLFGPVWGTAINVVAATIGASGTFFIGRKLGRAAVESRLQGRLKQLDEGLARDGLSYMLFVRLVPLFPFNGINYGAGLTRISFRDYLLGTFFGIMPGAAVFTYLGAAAADASPTRFLIGFGLLGLLALIPAFTRRRRGAAGYTPETMAPQPARADAQLAEQINAYHRIVRGAPPRRPGWWGFVRYFFLARHDVDGARLTLHGLEGRIRAHGDPRVHFALNCGATSCPPIREYQAASLDAQLDLATRAYFASPTGYRLDPATRTLHVSRLFRWYRRELGEPVAFIRRHVDAEARDALDRLGPSPRIAYLPWDWTPTA